MVGMGEIGFEHGGFHNVWCCNRAMTGRSGFTPRNLDPKPGEYEKYISKLQVKSEHYGSLMDGFSPNCQTVKWVLIWPGDQKHVNSNVYDVGIQQELGQNRHSI